MQNARLDEAQAGIKIARKNIYKLRYTDDTTLMAESEEELKSLLMKVKEENEKAGLKLNIRSALGGPADLSLASTVLGQNRPRVAPCSSLRPPSNLFSSRSLRSQPLSCPRSPGPATIF